jgi:hypothetical protein
MAHNPNVVTEPTPRVMQVANMVYYSRGRQHIRKMTPAQRADARLEMQEWGEMDTSSSYTTWGSTSSSSSFLIPSSTVPSVLSSSYMFPHTPDLPLGAPIATTSPQRSTRRPPSPPLATLSIITPSMPLSSSSQSLSSSSSLSTAIFEASSVSASSYYIAPSSFSLSSSNDDSVTMTTSLSSSASTSSSSSSLLASSSPSPFKSVAFTQMPAILPAAAEATKDEHSYNVVSSTSSTGASTSVKPLSPEPRSRYGLFHRNLDEEKASIPPLSSIPVATTAANDGSNVVPIVKTEPITNNSEMTANTNAMAATDYSNMYPQQQYLSSYPYSNPGWYI